MEDVLDPILFADALTPEEQQVWQQTLAADPALAASVAHWQQVRGALRQRLHEHVPDRAILVQWALSQTSDITALSETEQAQLTASQQQVAEALKAHPGLHDVVARIQQEAADFAHIWDEQMAPRPVRPTDRAARPLHRTRKTTRWAWRGVATTAILAFATVVTLLIQRDHNQITVATAADEVQVIELADGSTVRLMGASTLTYTDSEAGGFFDRRVHLTGQAYFDVSHDDRGFTVETRQALTTVLGTTFGVDAEAQRTEVVLVTGRVSLAPLGAEKQFVILEPGQQSQVTEGQFPTAPAGVDVLEALTWTGQFICQDTPLTRLTDQLRTFYDTPIHLDEALEDETLTGIFDQTQTLDLTLQEIATAIGATLTVTADGHTLLPTPTP